MNTNKQTGSPVATNGKQEAELSTLAAIRSEIDRVCSIYRTVGDAMHDDPRDRLALAINERFASLHAYAKAEELRAALMNQTGKAFGDTDAAAEAYRKQLASMGWDRIQFASDFLATYRAAALAKAGGQ